ncbi:DUF6920 family protein [Cyclobacterium xiamenense]|uniref:DUF6920 family protein n=1 Tax=Cyclobacterium xiamenense TaxID=1297121 RepID=UPI0012BA0FD2|nr:DUF6544 family protein [Cyclobacterium xiamenense]
MKITFILLLTLHALIHLLGFLKAFEWMELKALPLHLSKSTGLLWLMAGLGMILVVVAYAGSGKNWWYLALLVALFSQVLISLYWSEAKFGTLPNLLLLLVALHAWSMDRFERKVAMEVQDLFPSEVTSGGQAEMQPLAALPEPVQRWLKRSGAEATPIPSQVQVLQDFELKLKPEQTNWYRGSASQFFNPLEPGFVWSLNLSILPLVAVKGRDLLRRGNGEMLIKLWSLIPLVDEKDNPKIDEGSLQRFLGELVWFPSAARSSYLEWEQLGPNEAKATLSYWGQKATGTFTFDDSGRFLRFQTERYLGGEEGATRKPWIVEAKGYQTMEGVELPVQCEATWLLDEGPWTWARIRILSVTYRRDEGESPA